MSKNKMSHLHHCNQKESYQFITFRTQDSVDDFLLKIKAEQEDVIQRQMFFEDNLGISPKGAYLNGVILEAVKTIIFDQNKKLYDLISFSIMPNHIHILIKQIEDLNVIMMKLKSITAIKCNKLLGKSGKFWQSDYYDRIIRNEKHFDTVLNYIKKNAINAKLKDSEERFYIKDLE